MWQIFVAVQWFTVGVIVYQVWLVRKWHRLTTQQHMVITNMGMLIDCLATKSTLPCDVCGLPIAPKTPTSMEHTDAGWFVAHERCCP